MRFPWLLLFALVAACGRKPEPPRWSALTPAARRGNESSAFELPHPDLASTTVRVEPVAGGAWVAFELAREDWSPSAFPHTFVATTLLGPGVGRPPFGSPHELRDGDALYLDASELEEPHTPAFRVVGDRVFLTLPPEETPPTRLTFRAFHEEREDGRAQLGGVIGEGFRLWPGPGTELETVIPEDTTLRFQTQVRHATGVRAPAVRLVLEHRGVEAARLELPAGLASHAVDLPATGSGPLRWRLEGEPALVAILGPRLGPRSIGRPGARPWGTTRPDLFVYLADTFRADNLRTYGSDGPWTPALDAFAAESCVFLEAWSTSSWTLPSQASLLTGLHPLQHGATSPTRRLPDGLPTVAERLRAAGYRTVAVTDSLFVSARYGLDRGFEIFSEAHLKPGREDRRLEELLASDDGRPLFVYFQTYRAHAPYHVSPTTRAELEPELGTLREYHPLFEEINGYSWDKQGELPADMARTLDEFRKLYLAGVRDADRRFAEVLTLWREGGHLDEGTLLFTSDHGETFGEHLELFHGNTLFEEEIRVPLLVHGPRFPARVRQDPASLVDLPRTLVALAGLSPEDSWGGRDLTHDGDGPAVSAFGCFTTRRPPAQAVREGRRKLILPMEADAPSPRNAFDLQADPQERGSDWPEWAAELERRWLEEGRARRVPAAEGEELQLTPEERRELQAMGYGG